MPRANRTQSGDVFARSIPLIIEKHSFGTTRKADKSKIATKGDGKQTDLALLNLTKRLLNSKEIQDIRHLDGQFREQLQTLATPFRPGFYLVSHGMVDEAVKAAERWELERGLLADQAAHVYPAQVRAMREPLGPQFDPRNYPKVEQFRASFWVDWRFVNLGVPDALKEIKADVFRKETEKTQRLCQELRGTIEQHLLSSMLSITTHLQHLLTPTEHGKRRALRDGALDDLLHFLATVESRNITGHADLKRLSQQLRDLGSGLSLELLRDDDQLRASTAEKLTEVMSAVEELVEDLPDRAVRVREEEIA